MKIVTMCLVQLFASAVFAGSFDACKKEVKKFKCAGDEKAVYECLEKNAKALSAKCEKAHEAYEKKNNITPEDEKK